MLFEPAAVVPFPVRLEADYPERLSRLSTFFRVILAIPLLLFVTLINGGGFFGNRFDDGGLAESGAQITVGALGSLILAYWIAVLVRGRPVRWLLDVIVAIQRFSLRAATYFLLLTDRYPPFEGDWPVRLEVDYPLRLSRWRLVIWKTATVIPHFIVLAFVFIGVIVVVVLAWFAVLFTGRYPLGMHTFVSGWLRWYARAWAYWLSLTDEFPSFSLSAEVGPAYYSSYVISAVFGWLIVLAWVGGVSALIAWPGQTKEVSVSYQQLLQGEPSETVEVFDVEVVLLAAQDPYEFPDGFYQAEEDRRFVLFILGITNNRDSDFRTDGDDFRLKDSRGKSHDPFLATLGGLSPPGELEGGQQLVVGLLFEVPQEAEAAELKYDPGLGFKQKVKFTLE